MRFTSLRPTEPPQPEPDRLDEVRIEDASPNQFMVFLKKWRAFARKNSVYNYWVHFSNFRTDTTDKKFMDTPDHSDPVGLYVYPMKYVLSHPSDIWYGMKAANLFVIEASANKEFMFADVSSTNDIHRVVWDMFKGTWTISDYELNVLRNWFGWTGKGKYAKTLMSAIQFDWTKLPGKKITRQNLRSVNMEDSRWMDKIIRTGKEQTKLWLEAGYDMLVDTGTGAINDREPEQAIFLSRGAFKPIEKYQLRDLNQIRQTGITTNDPDDNFLRKVISMALSGMDGEALTKGAPLTDGQGGWRRWWTNNGWRASIKSDDISIEDKFNSGMKIGSKKHKEVKNHDNYALSLEIETPYGTVTGYIDVNDKLDAGVRKLWAEYADLKSARGGAHSPEWKAETLTDYLGTEKRKKQEYLWNKIRKEHGMKEIDSETITRMLKNGQGPLGWYYLPKANELRARRGLPRWEQDDWERYRDGKAKLYDVSGGPSQASRARLDAILKARQDAADPAGLHGRLPGNQAGEGELNRRKLFKVDPFSSHFGPRSLAAINAFRFSKRLPAMTPQQYEQYRQNPDVWRLSSYFPEPRRH